MPDREMDADFGDGAGLDRLLDMGSEGGVARG